MRPQEVNPAKLATKGHYDVPMRDCSVMLDNEVIIDAGRLVDDSMIVPREQR
jgi:2,5-dihydroxypyridine 5,6-dioxygenase